MKITVADLKRKHACTEAVEFYRRAQLDGIDWNNVRKIDLNRFGWAEWLVYEWPLTSISHVNNITYTYDDRGNRLSETYPNGRTCTYTYDDRGNQLSETYPNGRTRICDSPPPITIILTMVDGERITRTNKAPAMITGAKEKHNDR